MRLHRFIGDFDLSGKITFIRDKKILNQMRNVLRLKAGSEVILSDGKSNEVNAVIRKLERDSGEAEITEKSGNKENPAREAVLYCSLLKRENFEWVAQKATEIGVAKIVPLLTGRTVKLDFKRERIEKIAREAAEQSGRNSVPEISAPLKFEAAVREATEANGANFFFAVGEKNVPADEFNGKSKIGIFIGPEGGWTDEEMETAEKNGFIPAGLGTLVLRAETAAVVASYLAINS
jgi:16S rRNA (uracil1498-N3)-methyltransferase